MKGLVRKLPRPKSKLGAVAVTLLAWVIVPLPGVFEIVLFTLWPRKMKL
jgi:hypothetical protein